MGSGHIISPSISGLGLDRGPCQALYHRVGQKQKQRSAWKKAMAGRGEAGNGWVGASPPGSPVISGVATGRQGTQVDKRDERVGNQCAKFCSYNPTGGTQQLCRPTH